MDMIHLLSAPGDKTELNTLLEIARALEEADFTRRAGKTTCRPTRLPRKSQRTRKRLQGT